MEFLRFGSSIPGSYWGCCACCIIQNFKVDPDEKASIQLVGGDGGNPIVNSEGKGLFAGPTYRDIFWQRIRFGTHSNKDMPNHAFLAILSRSQLNTELGKKWLGILKEAGFEFIRTVNNSVWNVDNYIFGLIRNVGPNAVKDPFTPPKEWTDLQPVVPEVWDELVKPSGASTLDLAVAQRKAQKAIYDKIGPAKLLTEEEVVAAGAPVILSGIRSENPQELKKTREERKARKEKAGANKQPSAFPAPKVQAIG